VSGTVPRNQFFANISNVNAVEEPIEAGIVPDRELEFRLRCFSLIILAKAKVGIVPVRLLADRFILVREVSAQSSEGMDPLSLLSSALKTARSACTPMVMHVGIVPSKEFDPASYFSRLSLSRTSGRRPVKELLAILKDKSLFSVIGGRLPLSILDDRSSSVSCCKTLI
jgi:hypothetical protein